MVSIIFILIFFFGGFGGGFRSTVRTSKSDDREFKDLTAISFPAFSGLFPTVIAAAAAAPEEMPTWNPNKNFKNPN